MPTLRRGKETPERKLRGGRMQVCLLSGHVPPMPAAGFPSQAPASIQVRSEALVTGLCPVVTSTHTTPWRREPASWLRPPRACSAPRDRCPPRGPPLHSLSAPSAPPPHAPPPTQATRSPRSSPRIHSPRTSPRPTAFPPTQSSALCRSRQHGSSSAWASSTGYYSLVWPCWCP